MSNLYRKEALDKMTSPDQLDQVIVVTPPGFWLAMIGGAIILFAAILWSIVGRIPVEVETAGVFFGSSGTQDTVVCFVPVSDGKMIREGMEVMICPTTVSSQEYGHLIGTVTGVTDYVTSREDMRAILKDDSMVEYFAQSGPVIAVSCSLREDATTKSGYRWSSNRGAEVELSPGTMLEADIVIEKKAPITLLLPSLKERFACAGDVAPSGRLA